MLSLFDTITVAKPAVEETPALKQEFEISVNGEAVPVRIAFERRFNNRATVNKNGILLRISDKQNREEQRKQIDILLKWAKEKLGDKPELLDSLPQRKYVNGEMLKVGEHEFIISIHYHELNKSTSKIFKNNIVISLAKGLTKEIEQNTCSYLISKCLCKYFQPLVEERVRELNGRFFKKQVNTVKMKYAASFWGHCSTTGHIVISVRLMFAPRSVIDYVLIHELAHLVHHDHSPRFWKVVENIMPSYRNAEVHLKENHFKYFL